MNIDELLASPEGKTLEFKQDISSPRPILKSLVAFANSAGGRLVIGVADDKQLVGVENPLDEEERLCNLISDSISPRLVPNIELVTVEGKTLLIIEVESPGILLSGLTINDMKQGTSRIHNHVIARVFRELNLIKQWGTGVRRIFEEAKELGLPEPKIEEIGMHLRFTVYLSQPHIIAPTASGEKSAGKLREMLGLKHRHSFRENYFHPALEQGLIERTIPDKPNSRLQKYRLTREQGEQIMVPDTNNGAKHDLLSYFRK